MRTFSTFLPNCRFRLVSSRLSKSFFQPTQKYHVYYPNKKRYQLWKYIGFTIGGSATAYLLAAVWDAEKEKARRHQWLQETKKWVSGKNEVKLNSLLTIQREPGSPLKKLQDYWNGLGERQRTMFCLIGLNLIVFGAWRVPSLDRIMTRYFLHSTHSHPITLLTSTFSHHTPMHLIFNMLALYSFGQVLHDRMGREQFVAFYLTAGMSASLGSHLVRLWRGEAVRSLGASGALFAVAGACAHIPNVNVSLIFLPFHSIPIGYALPGLMTLDLVGLVKRWQVFDHAAHLSGAIFGYLFYPLSQRKLWANRQQVLKFLHYPLHR